MASIDELIAGSGKTNANFDFDSIINKPAREAQKSTFEAQDQAAKNAVRDAFKGGLPMKEGQIDWPTISKTLIERGAINEGIAANTQGQTQQKLEYGQRSSDLAFPSAAATIVSPPSANRSASAIVAPPLNKGGEQKQGPQGDQPGSIVGLVSAAGVPDELAGPIIQQVSAATRMDPNAAVNPQMAPRVAQIVQEAVRRTQQAGQPQPQQAPPVPPQQPPTSPPQDPTLGGLVPPGRTAPQQIDLLSRAIGSGLLSAEQAKAYQSRIEAITKAIEPTNEMKNAAASGALLPYQEKQGELAAQQAGATERAKNDVAEQKLYIDNGRMASQRLGTLNTISNIVQSDKNLNLGFGSETTLKIKMALEQAGLDFGDLSGAQLIQKLNGVLASESSKAFSTRPTQFEFKTFLANNPGLGLDEKGNIRMLGILSQTAKREYELGKLARKNQDNWENWDNVVEAYDKKFPVKDPTTGKILSSNSIIAPGPKQGSQKFSSPSDVHAAIAAGQLKKGDSFQDANGKTRFVP